MTTFQASKTMLPLQQTIRHRILPIPILAAICWLCLQKGCVWNPDISPAHAIVDADVVVTGQEPSIAEREKDVPTDNLPIMKFLDSAGGEQSSPNKSLQQASNLLRKAAAMLDKNDRRALRLILQAISILKHEILRDAAGLEHDRVSLSPFSSDLHEFQENTPDLPSLLRHQISRHTSSLQLDEPLATPLPLSGHTN